VNLSLPFRPSIPDYGCLGIHSQSVFASGNALYTFPKTARYVGAKPITPVQRMTCDITHAMPTGENHPRGDLHAGMLACAASITLDESNQTTFLRALS